MIQTQNPSPRLHARLTSYTALAGALLASHAVATSADATVITSGPQNIAIPATADGIYLNLITGVANASAAAVPGWDFNPYGSTGLLFYWGGTGALNAGVASTTTGPYIVLSAGATIGPASTYSQSANGANNETSAFRAGVNGYLGISFRNETTGVTNYGYIHLQTTAATGYPATILDWAYENSGAAITIPAVPEPATVTLLGVMAAGAVGVRQWRRRKAA